MLEELNVRELLSVFLMRVLDLGILLITDAVTENVCLHAFKALFCANCFGGANSSTLPEMHLELRDCSRAGLQDVVALLAVTSW